MKKVLLFTMLCITASALVLASTTWADPWKFGVLSDTQWVVADDGKNPYSTAIDIVNQANAAFIAANVKFVIAVGDLVDSGTSTTSITNGSWYPGLSAALVQANCAASNLCTGNFTPAPYAPGFFPAGTFASGATYSGSPTWSIGVAGQAARAAFAQSLYNAGIGFFPFRGNHDDSQAAGAWFQYLYPQTQNGKNNMTPADAHNLVISAAYPDSAKQPAISNTNGAFQVGSHFSSPSENLTGLSYAFTYNNATFVLIDQFTPLDGAANNTEGADNLVGNQQSWISNVLQAKTQYPSKESHAFVFSHKGLITEDHTDVLFGTNPGQDPAAMDTFIETLANNGGVWYIGGHDHMHVRETVTTSDGVTAKVHELVCASDSDKFYTPDTTPNAHYTKSIQTILSEDLYYIPYYIVTVDGPRVTFDYYAVNSNGGGSNIPTTPPLTGNWQHRETWGYSFNGKEFSISEGSSYTTVHDAISAGTDAYGSTFFGTSAAILSGTNGSTGQEKQTSRAFVKDVNTGWAPRIEGITLSDVFTLWGMADVSQVSAGKYDTYTVSVSYDPTTVTMAKINAGHPAYLATKGANGNWVNAASGRFILGPWNAKYPLGFYGIDMSTNTAWAVVNAPGGDFTVIQP
jgi:hypothetical protein